VTIYSWTRRLTGPSKSRWPAVAAAVFFLVTPGAIAAHVWIADFAPVAEFVFLVLTYLLWREIEATPADWEGITPFSPDKRRWLLKWTGLALCTYLGYKTKADVKLVPVIFALYILLLRRRQWKLFAAPMALMVLLAVPWSTSRSMTKLPPFLPGSGGSATNWMWQPASLDRLGDFLWSSDPYSFTGSLKSGTLSLAGTLGPFLLTALIVFILWNTKLFEKIPWTAHTMPPDRARIFVLLWLAVILAGASALPAINYFFRIRYAILPLVPVSILLGWLLDYFHKSRDRLPRWAVAVFLALLILQTGVNFSRSLWYRRSLGQTMVAVDQAYERINAAFPDDDLALMPDFLPYAYREGAASTFQHMDSLGNAEDLLRRHRANRTSVLSWEGSLWEELDMAAHFSGCRSTTLFDRVMPCAPGTGIFLSRFIGPDRSFLVAEVDRGKGDMAAALRGYEEFVARHPNNLGGQFWLGFAAYYQKDWAESERANQFVESYLPNHPSAIYNRAITLMELQQYGPAIERLDRIVEMNPQNTAAQLNLYWAHRKAGHKGQAAERLQAMLRLFPADPAVQQLAASAN
jgi:tetratricopeptide (TPR) repeat protein